MASGVPCLNLIVWSHGCDSKNYWDASSLKRCLKCLYSLGISTFLFPSPAWMANLVAISLIILWVSNCCMISCLVVSLRVIAITVLLGDGMVNDMTTGRACTSIMALCHLNSGLKVTSHRYPRRRSLLLISAIRDHISLTSPLVCTLRSRKWVIVSNLFTVLSMLKIFLAYLKPVVPLAFALQVGYG